MAAQKTVVEASSEAKRTWNLKKGTVTLSFTLRTDIKGDMKDFVELLERATEEVKKQIAEKQ